MFRSLVKDVFAGLPDSSKDATAASAHSRSSDVEAALESTATENGYVSHKQWLDKCMQLYNVSQVHHGKLNGSGGKDVHKFLRVYFYDIEMYCI